MFSSGRRHRHAVAALLAGLFVAIACAWTQWVDSAVAAAQPTTLAEISLPIAPTPRPTTPAVAPMAAATSTGQFEALVVPTLPPTPSPTITPTTPPSPTPNPTTAPEPSPAPLSVLDSGIASTYGSGDGFEGRRTACGQIFHTLVVQVAHKTLPCGTLLRIEDTATGSTVDAEVTDRGPYIRGRIVDLSWAAFRQLDPNGPGLLHVNIYVLDQ